MEKTKKIEKEKDFNKRRQNHEKKMGRTENTHILEIEGDEKERAV